MTPSLSEMVEPAMASLRPVTAKMFPAVRLLTGILSGPTIMASC